MFFGMAVFVIIGIVVAIAVICWAASEYFERQRRAALLALAGRPGLSYDPGRNHELAAACDSLNKLRQGGNRYAYDVIAGIYQEQPVCCFSHHFETHGTDSKGRQTTHHHQLGVSAIALPRAGSSTAMSATIGTNARPFPACSWPGCSSSSLRISSPWNPPCAPRPGSVTLPESSGCRRIHR